MGAVGPTIRGPDSAEMTAFRSFTSTPQRAFLLLSLSTYHRAVSEKMEAVAVIRVLLFTVDCSIHVHLEEIRDRNWSSRVSDSRLARFSYSRNFTVLKSPSARTADGKIQRKLVRHRSRSLPHPHQPRSRRIPVKEVFSITCPALVLSSTSLLNC